jgi:hypothetical protein
MMSGGTYIHVAGLYPDNRYPAAQRNVTVSPVRGLYLYYGYSCVKEVDGVQCNSVRLLLSYCNIRLK